MHPFICSSTHSFIIQAFIHAFFIIPLIRCEHKDNHKYQTSIQALRFIEFIHPGSIQGGQKDRVLLLSFIIPLIPFIHPFSAYRLERCICPNAICICVSYTYYTIHIQLLLCEPMPRDVNALLPKHSSLHRNCWMPFQRSWLPSFEAPDHSVTIHELSFMTLHLTNTLNIPAAVVLSIITIQENESPTWRETWYLASPIISAASTTSRQPCDLAAIHWIISLQQFLLA